MSAANVHIREAIDALESRHDLFAPEELKTILTVLRDHLPSQDIKTAPPAQRKQVTVLFANVSGFTQVAENLRDTNLLDIMNLLWQQFDEAIKIHGGTVDKHMGDGVMGVFGMHVAQEDDPARAVRAALAMRVALSDFLRELQQVPLAPISVQGREIWVAQLQKLQIRIGVNTGPVLLGGVGTEGEVTVIGDAVNVGRRLEQAAPAGDILIAQDTFTQVRGLFNVKGMGPLTVKGRTDPVTAYLVLEAKPRLLRSASRGVEGVETRMVGREVELAQLQSLLRGLAKARQGQMLTIIGEAGVGKSRLIHELVKWIQSAAGAKVVLMKGRAEPEERPLPFTLIRDMFAAYFDIRDSDRATIAEEKLVAGMQQFLIQPEADIRLRATVISQLIGLGGADRRLRARPEKEPNQLRDRAFRYVTGLFTAIAASSRLTLLVLEDIHWSDPESLFFVKHLSRVCRREPLLILSLTRPALFENLPDWLEEANGIRHDQMLLKPLPDSASYRLVQNILRKLPEVPTTLSEQIVDRAEGNPFYVEELIKVLIEDGVIIPGERQWRLQPASITHVRVPPTLRGVLQARLDRLSTLERTTLQKASVIGRIFWDAAVSQIRDDAGQIVSEREILSALKALQKRELIYRRRTSGFTSANAFIFKHAILRDVTYESVLLRRRPHYHRQVADWLVSESGERVAEYASAIAEHYELAEEKLLASQFYGTAAGQAQERYNPDLAITYYRKELALLSEYYNLREELLQVHERLADLLRQQVRLIEATQIYNMMRHTADMAGDLEAQSRAYCGLAAIKRYQADYAGALQQAEQAIELARLVGSDLQLVRARHFQIQAQMELGNFDDARTAAAGVLARCRELQLSSELVAGLRLMCLIYLRSGRGELAQPFLERLRELEASYEKAEAWSQLAYVQVQQGDLYKELGRYNKAAQLLMEALRIYQELDDQVQIGHTLDLLGMTALLQGNGPAASALHEKALQVAHAAGDRRGELQYQMHLGASYVASRTYGEAIRILRRTIDTVQNELNLINWSGLGAAYAVLAAAYLRLGNGVAAESAVFRALSLARQGRDRKALGDAWRMMGLIAADKGVPLRWNDSSYDVSVCFSRGLRALRGAADRTTWREQAQLLWQWAGYEEEQQRIEKANQLRRRARRMVANMDLTTKKLEQFE